MIVNLTPVALQILQLFENDVDLQIELFARVGDIVFWAPIEFEEDFVIIRTFATTNFKLTLSGGQPDDPRHIKLHVVAEPLQKGAKSWHSHAPSTSS